MPNEIRDVRHAAYIIPARIRNGKPEIAIIEYKPGAYGTIGGRFEDDDTSARAVLRRELTEELNPSAIVMADFAVQMVEPYSFCVAQERVALRCARAEHHHFFFTWVPENFEITFCEKRADNVHIVWLDAESLVDANVVGFDDECEYFEQYIMPLIRKM